VNTIVLGVDIGGSHIACAPVDIVDGELVSHHEQIRTPTPGTPDQLVDAIGQLADRFCWTGPIGVTFPGVVEHGIVRTAAHLDASWVGVDLDAAVRVHLGQPVTAINDADAAGLAEIRFGAAYGHPGVVVVVTLGTGVGTGVFVDGTLVPNTELGHLPFRDGREADVVVAARARPDDDESWESWGTDVGTYLQALEQLLWPSLIVIGGGVSERFDDFAGFLGTRTPVVAARHTNEAGIIGAALATSGASLELVS
jgi:polyphosphate glucokinase